MLTFGRRYALSDKDGQTPESLQIGPWRAVLEGRHDFDAHAHTYLVYGQAGVSEHQFRVSVSSPHLDRVLCHTVFLDYDGSNDHAAVLEALQEIPTDHYLYRTTAIYPTKSGMRIVYRLERPVRIAEFGPLVRGMCVDLFRLTKLQCDPTTDQWFRSFRLPKVIRDDEKALGPTWELPYFFEPLIGDATIDPDEVRFWNEKLPWDHRARRQELAPSERPDPIPLPSHRSTLYTKVLKLSRFRGYLYDGQSIPEGRRDQTLMAMTSEVIAKCFNGVVDSSAEEIYQLIRPVTDMMQNDGSEPWEQKLWRFVQHIWGQEVKEAEKRREKQEQDLTQRDVILNRMVEQLPKELIPTDPFERRAFIERHFCLQVATGAYVVTTRGEYTKVPLRASQIPAHFNDNLHCLVDGGFRNAKGGILTGSVILNQYSTNVDDVQYKVGDKPGARLIVDNDKKILEIIPFALRQDLLEAAEYDNECAEWLEQFTDHQTLIRWIAAALDIERPIAACYLKGPARVGKTMMALALGECFHCPPIPAAHAFGEFNGELMKSPIVMIDEGLPTKLTGLDPADIFRSLVTGSPVATQNKYQLPVIASIPYRLIFAANSFDMVRHLIGRRTMDSQDRDAFRERILVIDTGSKPAELLDSKGARRYTKDWIGGNYRLARHFLKLYKTFFLESEFVPDGRLLVEGKPHPAFTLSFDLSGQGREVVDDLTSDIVKLKTGKVNNGVELTRALQIENGAVWLKKRPYVKMQCSRSPTRADGYSRSLDRFLTGETRTSELDLSMQFRVDVKKLLFCAKAEGLEVKHLQDLELEKAGVA